MLKKLLFRKIKLFLILAITIILLIAGIFLVVSAKIEAEYVSDNYITASSVYSPKISKSAFVYDYTLKTGDNTLASITGMSASAINKFGSSVVPFYSDTDLRGLVQSVARAWISKDRYADGDEVDIVKVQDSYGGMLSVDPAPNNFDGIQSAINSHFYPLTGLSSSDVSARKAFKLYGSTSSECEIPIQQYDVILSNGTTRTFKTYRCCCCLCEIVSDIAIEAPSQRDGHVRAVGLHESAISNGQDLDDSGMQDFTNARQVSTEDSYARWLQYPLSNEVTNANTKISALVESGDIRVGTILLWSGYKAGTDSRHVDVVTYIEKNADGSGKVYIAGAANDWRIIADAAWGYDKVKEYDENSVWTSWDEDGDIDGKELYLVNAVHYQDCIRHN